MRPVLEASDGSRTRSPPSPNTIHFGHAQPCRGGGLPGTRWRVATAAWRCWAWLDHGKPRGALERGRQNPGAFAARPARSRARRGDRNQAITGGGRPAGSVEQHAAFCHAGHAEPAYPDWSPGRFRPRGPPARSVSTATSTRRYGSILGLTAAAGCATEWAAPRRRAPFRDPRADHRPWPRSCRCPCRSRHRRRRSWGVAPRSRVR